MVLLQKNGGDTRIIYEYNVKEDKMYQLDGENTNAG